MCVCYTALNFIEEFPIFYHCKEILINLSELNIPFLGKQTYFYFKQMSILNSNA